MEYFERVVSSLPMVLVYGFMDAQKKSKCFNLPCDLTLKMAFFSIIRRNYNFTLSVSKILVWCREIQLSVEREHSYAGCRKNLNIL